MSSRPEILHGADGATRAGWVRALRRLLSSRAIRVLAAVALAALLMSLAVRGVDFGRLLSTLRHGELHYLLLALCVALVSPLLRAWRWRLLFAGEKPPLRDLVEAVTTGQTLNFLIFRTGDVARVLMVPQRKWTAAGTIGIEKALDAAFFAAICLALPLFWIIPESLQGARLTAIVVGGVLLLAGLVLIPRLPRMEIELSWRVLGLVGAASALIWAGSLANNYLMLQFIGLSGLPWFAPMALLVILQVGSAVPLTPGKVGQFQALAILGLTLFNVEDQTQALAFGLALHALVFFPAAAVALGFWILRTKR